MDIKKRLEFMNKETESCGTRTGELLPKIVVKDPVTHDSWAHGKFTSYQICIKTDHPAFRLRLSSVRRRYNEIKWLYSVLKANHRTIPLPALPPKHIWAERFDSKFINKRMKDIEVFLNQLMVTDTILSDAAFHIFLQTDLTTDEIDEYFDGKLSEDFVEAAWKNAGHLHTSSYVVSTHTIPYEPQQIEMNEEDEALSGRSSASSISESDSSKNTSQGTQEAIGEEPKNTNFLTANQRASRMESKNKNFPSANRNAGHIVNVIIEENGATGLSLDIVKPTFPLKEGLV